MKRIDIGYIDIPVDYFKLGPEERKVLCELVIDNLYKIVDKQLKPEVDRIEALNDIFDSTIEMNEKEENYELCQVLMEIKKNLNEPID